MQSHDRTCVTRSNSKGIRRIATIAERTELKKGLAEPEGANIQEIVAPLMRGLSVSSEGSGTLSLQIETTFAGDQKALAAATAEIEVHGLVDDAISGMHYKIRFVATQKGWKATDLSRKQICAR